ncbi:MAG: chromosome segregation protein SMC [Hydrogenothermaceae bacterium]|nr:chromosome segregation protein SMC [Hydrogenothermaceae bacterium]
MKKAYISNIEVYGFKSYGDRRISIPLSEGFTAIVGPNGAGKSNIGDSIAFCLSIASTKAMRATKLTDLIFSTKNKTAPFTEVEITFKNLGAFPVNSEEIRIYRKVDLSGKSIYKINSRVVKQKDVQDLLVEANIYPQGYNIITQGDIYKFVKMTPTERRDLISEVAGISEYEEKKQKALEELSQTQEKINQVKIVLREIETTLKRLEEEKENAQLAQALEEKIEFLKNQINGVKLFNLSKELSKVEGDLKSIEDRISGFYHRKEEIANIVRDYYIQIKEYEDKLNQINELFLPFKQQEGFITAQIKEKNEKIDNIQKQEQELQDKLRQLSLEKADKLQQITHINKEIENLYTQIPLLKQQLKEKEILVEEKSKKIKELETSQGKSKEDLITLETREREIKDRLNNLQRERDNLSMKLSNIDDKIKHYREEIIALESDIEKLSKELSSIQTDGENFELKVNSLNSQVSMYKVRREALEKKLKEIRQKIEENFRQLASVLAQLSQFKDDKISLILKDIPGVYGQVSDLITLKDEKFQTAIETAAGSRLKNIVVENEEVAKRCIEILKREKVGRTVFIPLTTIKYQEPPKLPSRRGILGYAIDFVIYEPKIEKAIKYVFSDTVVVENFDYAKDIGIGNFRMVTLDGELFEKSGTISGGSERQTSSIGKGYLENKKVILEKEDEKLKKEEEKLENEIKVINQTIADIESQINKIVSDSKTYQYRVNDLKNQINQKSARLSNLENQINQLKLESFDIESKLGEIEKEYLTTQKIYEDISKKKQDILSKIENTGFYQLRQEWEKETSEYYKISEKIKELNISIDNLQNRIKENLQPRIDQIEKEELEIQQKLNSFSELKQQLNQEIKDLSQQLSDLWKELKEKDKERNEIINQIEYIKNQIKNLRYEEDELNRQITFLQEDKGKISQRIIDLHQEIEILKMEYDGEPVEADLKTLEKEVRETENRRKSLGGVNQKAIEDYKEALNRYQDINEKFEVLLKEKKAIDDLIQTLEDKKVKAFMEVYEHINQNLAKNFKVLSPGGKAYLELENPLDPLSAGVLIKAKPRGKEITRLEVMSGGEKTITALAFLFAVLSVKPAPFYYLDEVDAALDEINAKKVAQLIKELSKTAQFIVVTHKEIMASYADTLIGVSAKDGISSVYTLDISSLIEQEKSEVV